MAMVIGVETEYGVAILGEAPADSVVASQLVLQAFQSLGQACVPCFSPLSEFVPRGDRHTSAFEPSLMLANGARLYIDHAHPEYCTPECVSPLSLVAADRAGERLLAACQHAVNQSGVLPDGHELRLYKNNSDHKGASYGCHENYLISPRLYENLVYRRAPQLYHILIPFLVTRQIFCGAGKVGAEHIGAPAGFQLSQRADFFETLLGLQTMYRRPLINLRDEPHCDPQAARRLHVIVGDATMAELSTYLKVGVTQLVLAMLEADDAHDALALAKPLAALGQVSRDLAGTHLLGLADGRQMTARELQLRLLELVHAFLSRYGGSDEQWELWQEWERVLGLLPAAPALSQSLDWAIKAQVLDRYLASRQLDWADVAAWQPVIEYALSPAADLHSTRTRAAEAGLPWADYEAQREAYFALRRLDLEYHDLRPGRSGGLFMQLEHQGLVERLLHDDDIEHLMAYPPAETRAWTRGAWIRDQRQRVLAADWSALLVAPADGTQQPFSVLLTHPLRGAMDSSAAIPGSPEP